MPCQVMSPLMKIAAGFSAATLATSAWRAAGLLAAVSAVSVKRISPYATSTSRAGSSRSATLNVAAARGGSACSGQARVSRSKTAGKGSRIARCYALEAGVAMRILVLAILCALSGAAANAAAPGSPAPACRERAHRARQLGHRACLWQIRRRHGVRYDLRASRGRLRPHRTELPRELGDVGAGRRRGSRIQRSSRASVRRPAPPAAGLSRKPGVAQVADGGLVGRTELLSVEKSRRYAEGHPSLRALDGAVVHRRQHWRRYRKRRPTQAAGILRPATAAADARRRRGD